MRWLKILIGIVFLVLAVRIGEYLYFMPKFHKTEKAPDFTVPLIDGSQLSLTDLRGSYVLLDFWGSWCGPCRKENPKLVELYRQYEGQGFKDGRSFEIVSLGLENREESWIRAIRKDNLYWKYHHAEFNRMRSAVGNLYGVREIPTKYLIGPDRSILMVNPTVSEIDQFLRARVEGTKG